MLMFVRKAYLFCPSQKKREKKNDTESANIEHGNAGAFFASESSYKSLFGKDFTQKLMFLFLTLMDDDSTLSAARATLTAAKVWDWASKQKKLVIGAAVLANRNVLAMVRFKSAVIWRMTSSQIEQMNDIDLLLAFGVVRCGVVNHTKTLNFTPWWDFVWDTKQTSTFHLCASFSMDTLTTIYHCTTHQKQKGKCWQTNRKLQQSTLFLRS